MSFVQLLSHNTLDALHAPLPPPRTVFSTLILASLLPIPLSLLYFLIPLPPTLLPPSPLFTHCSFPLTCVLSILIYPTLLTRLTTIPDRKLYTTTLFYCLLVLLIASTAIFPTTFPFPYSNFSLGTTAVGITLLHLHLDPALHIPANATIAILTFVLSAFIAVLYLIIYYILPPHTRPLYMMLFEPLKYSCKHLLFAPAAVRCTPNDWFLLAHAIEILYTTLGIVVVHFERDVTTVIVGGLCYGMACKWKLWGGNDRLDMLMMGVWEQMQEGVWRRTQQRYVCGTV